MPSFVQLNDPAELNLIATDPKIAKAHHERRMLLKFSQPEWIEEMVGQTIAAVDSQRCSALAVFEMLGVPIGSIVANRLRMPLLIFRQKSEQLISGEENQFWRASFPKKHEGQEGQLRLLKKSVQHVTSVTIFDEDLTTGAQCEAALEICRSAKIKVARVLFLQGNKGLLTRLQAKYQDLGIYFCILG